MSENILHSFEAGRRGKPDEFESQIANLLGAELLKINSEGKFDLRIVGSYNSVLKKEQLRLSGEVSDFLLNTPNLNGILITTIKKHFLKTYNSELDISNIIIELNAQSEILAENSDNNAGDSGTAIAVAYKNTPLHLPWERYLAVGIRDLLDYIYEHNGNLPEELTQLSDFKLQGLKADGKVEVLALYNNVILERVTTITIATEHEKGLDIIALREKITAIVNIYLSYIEKEYGTQLGNPEITINGAGEWNNGGWATDAGSREAKPYRDGFSSYGVCEDSFSGEDPSKPSATATLFARYIAVSIVKANLADFARVVLAYQIGKSHPIINITTNNTAQLSQAELKELVLKNFKLQFSETVSELNLKDSRLFRLIANNSDYFQSLEYKWNIGKRL